jgi:hypothetical protein
MISNSYRPFAIKCQRSKIKSFEKKSKLFPYPAKNPYDNILIATLSLFI